MANQEHLDLLQQGVGQWNRWRQEHSETQPDLQGANLDRANLSFANLSQTNLDAADLSHTDLMGVNFSKASLRNASFNDAYLLNADLSDADLRDADFGFADLSFTNLSHANLGRADLGFAKINGATLQGADFSQVRLSQTVFTGVDLRGVRGLKTVEHAGPSSIGIDTLYNSRGQIAKVFLRNAGVPETFLTSIDTLIRFMSPADFSSCFISYSNQDQKFVQRLYGSLQSRGIRCWFAPEDLKIGEKIRSRLDEAIRHYDKLLLVLSQYSVISQWVEQEVETTLEKEQKEMRIVLFPILIDNTVMEMKGGWPAFIRNTRHIGDFTHWTDPQAYQQAFERLLSDLKAEAS